MSKIYVLHCVTQGSTPVIIEGPETDARLALNTYSNPGNWRVLTHYLGEGRSTSETLHQFHTRVRRDALLSEAAALKARLAQIENTLAAVGSE